MAKEPGNQVRSWPREQEKILVSFTPGRGLVSRIYKELKTLNIKTRNNPVYKSGWN